MLKDYQVTLYCATKQYRPVSCIVKMEEGDITDKDFRKALITKGTQKICQKRYWTARELKQYQYKVAKVRPYEKS